MTQRKFKIFVFNKCVGASQFVRSVDLTPNFYKKIEPSPFLPSASQTAFFNNRPSLLSSCSVLRKEEGQGACSEDAFSDSKALLLIPPSSLGIQGRNMKASLVDVKRTGVCH